MKEKDVPIDATMWMDFEDTALSGMRQSQKTEAMGVQ